MGALGLLNLGVVRARARARVCVCGGEGVGEKCGILHLRRGLRQCPAVSSLSKARRRHEDDVGKRLGDQPPEGGWRAVGRAQD